MTNQTPKFETRKKMQELANPKINKLLILIFVLKEKDKKVIINSEK